MKITTVTVAVWLAFASPGTPPAPSPAPVKCCGKCNGTGMVRSGDGIALVRCPCPDSCPCAKNRPKSAACDSGSCPKVMR